MKDCMNHNMNEPTATDTILAALSETHRHFDGKIGDLRLHFDGRLDVIVAEQKRLSDRQEAQGERLANIEGQLFQIGLRIGDINARLPVPIAYSPPEPRRTGTG